MMTVLWDYLSSRDSNEMQAWASELKLGVRERAQLNQKLDMLERVGFETARSLKFLAGTSGDYNHIFKLVVHSQRMLRPMLCRGPLDAQSEITLLLGAIEKDFKLEPHNAAERADQHRSKVAMDGGKRINHERF
jgi:hypothetical protein